MTVHLCANGAGWHPTLHARQSHHHPPTAWRKLLLAADPEVDQSWWRIVPLCGIDHDEYHTLLDAHVRARGVPPASVTRTYGRFVRALVAEAWQHRPSDRPPYTLLPRG